MIFKPVDKNYKRHPKRNVLSETKEKKNKIYGEIRARIGKVPDSLAGRSTGFPKMTESLWFQLLL